MDRDKLPYPPAIQDLKRCPICEKGQLIGGKDIEKTEVWFCNKCTAVVKNKHVPDSTEELVSLLTGVLEDRPDES